MMTGMSRLHRILRVFRIVHLYVGIFIAPALLFFAFTGVLQTFSLHESTAEHPSAPPKWIATLSQVHKKQTTIIPQRRPRPAASAASALQPAQESHGSGQVNPATVSRDAPQTANAKQPASRSHLPLKIFFLVVSTGLFMSTLTGIYMSYKYSRQRFVMTGLLIAGLVAPLTLLPM